MIKIINRLASTVMVALLIPGCSIFSSSYSSGSVSPQDFGLSLAHSGEARYEVLYRTHQYAVEHGVDVDYSGIKSINLTIPETAKSIPLTSKTDFKGCVLNVKNNRKHLYLFTMVNNGAKINVDKADIDKGRFSKYSALATGSKLLIISDDTPWVNNRIGYSYGHVRKDILLIKNGKAVNSTVMPYNNTQSVPSCTYINVSTAVSLLNVTLNRTAESTFRTMLCNIQGCDNVLLDNVVVNTPENDMTSDSAISLANCTNVTFQNVRINRTYSRKDYSGYGVSLNNIWNFTATKLIANGNWGIFGNNNMNCVKLVDCDINRFDVHCYGRDFRAERTTFRDLYNQFSSFYGEMVFEDCQFINFTPVLFETSYAAYTPFEIVMKNCDIQCGENKTYLISAGYFPAPSEGAREEVKTPSWPNVTLEDVTVHLPDNKDTWSIFYTRGTPSTKADYMDKLTLKSVAVLSGNGKKAHVKLSNNPLKTVNNINTIVTRSSVSIVEF